MVNHFIRSHNKTLLIFHLVCPIKYRRSIFTSGNEVTFKSVCLEIGIRYNYEFLEIGIDENHVHFLIQIFPNTQISGMVKTIKSLTAREMFKRHPEVKKFLWGGQFWTDGYYLNTVGRYGDLKMIENYVKKQGKKDYKQLHFQNLKSYSQAT
jgi:putative transposase